MVVEDENFSFHLAPLHIYSLVTLSNKIPHVDSQPSPPSEKMFDSQFYLPFIILYLVYKLVVIIHRLYFSPLRNFPGPRLAAMTTLYEFYYDALRGYTFVGHIKELHQKYGIYS